MEYITLDLYDSFGCLAGECTSTCCAGWNIIIDHEDYKRFLHLEPGWLRQDILSNIISKDGVYYFKNQKNGECSMLDGDGLCRIQRNTNEKTLCNTCRKYPRLMNIIEQRLYLSMAASCPVVSNYIVRKQVRWNYSDIDGERKSLFARNLPIIKEAFEIYFLNEQIAQSYQEKRSNASLLIFGFEKIVGVVLDIILSLKEGNYLIKEFQIFEKELEKEKLYVQMERFLAKNKETWDKIKNNYIEYRLLSRKIEFVTEKAYECVLQMEAELLLMRTIAFCRYVTNLKIYDQDWCEIIQMVYRFCVHGKQMGAFFHHDILSLFSQDYIWNYMLL